MREKKNNHENNALPYSIIPFCHFGSWSKMVLVNELELN